MAKIVLDNFLGGLAPRWFNGANLVKLASRNMYAQGTVNPFIYPGFLAPGNATFTDLSQINELTNEENVVAFVGIRDNNLSGITGQSIYAGTEGGEIHGIDSTDKILASGDSSGEFPHTIAPASGAHNGHSGFEIEDMVEYQIYVSGTETVRRLFYAYTDTTDGDIGTYDLASSFTADTGGSNTEDVLSQATGGSVLTSESPVVLTPADNGFLYILQGNSFHKFDGTVDGGAGGTATMNVVKLSRSRKIIDAADGLGYMWIATKSAHTATTDTPVGLSNISVLVWNRSSTQIGFDDNIIIDGAEDIYAIFFNGGIPYCFTLGQDNIVQLRAYTGGRFDVVAEIDQLDGGAPATRNSIAPLNNGFTWLDGEGTVWFYGEVVPGAGKGLHRIGKTSTDGRADTGAIIMKNDSTLYMSYQKASSGAETIVSFDPFAEGSTATGGSSNSLKTPMIPLPKLSRITNITVYWLPFSGGADVNMSMNVFTNYNSTASNGTAFSINYAARDEAGFYATRYVEENVFAVQLELQWAESQTINASPIISRIEIEYEPLDKLNNL